MLESLVKGNEIYIICTSFICFDVLTGLLKAGKKRKINSSVLRKGLFNKTSEILTVVGSGLLEYTTKYIGFENPIPLLGVTATYICVMELTSIIENLCAVNPALNNLFKPYLEKLKEGEKDGN